MGVKDLYGQNIKETARWGSLSRGRSDFMWCGVTTSLQSAEAAGAGRTTLGGLTLDAAAHSMAAARAGGRALQSLFRAGIDILRVHLVKRPEGPLNRTYRAGRWWLHGTASRRGCSRGPSFRRQIREVERCGTP